jgi:hypothetical protein
MQVIMMCRATACWHSQDASTPDRQLVLYHHDACAICALKLESTVPCTIQTADKSPLCSVLLTELATTQTHTHATRHKTRNRTGTEEHPQGAATSTTIACACMHTRSADQLQTTNPRLMLATQTADSCHLTTTPHPLSKSQPGTCKCCAFHCLPW